MEKLEKPENIYQSINTSLSETVELAQEISTTLSLQGEQISNQYQEVTAIDQHSKIAHKKVKMMNSVLYRWWTWLAEIGTNVTTTISNGVTSLSKSEPETECKTKTEIKIGKINNEKLESTSNNDPSRENNCLDDDNIKNLNILKQISLSIGEELDMQCKKYSEIHEITENSSARIDKTCKISNKMC